MLDCPIVQLLERAMLVIMSITHLTVEQFTREVWPFLLALFAVLP